MTKVYLTHIKHPIMIKKCLRFKSATDQNESLENFHFGFPILVPINHFSDENYPMNAFQTETPSLGPNVD